MYDCMCLNSAVACTTSIYICEVRHYVDVYMWLSMVQWWLGDEGSSGGGAVCEPGPVAT